MLSGVLFLRAFWLEKESTGKRYIHIFCVISILYELLQWFDFMPGAFDALDLVVMASAASVEGVFYNCFVRRGIGHEKRQNIQARDVGFDTDAVRSAGPGERKPGAFSTSSKGRDKAGYSGKSGTTKS
jgi:hypothetical protein